MGQADSACVHLLNRAPSGDASGKSSQGIPAWFVKASGLAGVGDACRVLLGAVPEIRHLQLDADSGSPQLGFTYVGQAGLKHLTSSYPPASASQSAEITGMSHCARPAMLPPFWRPKGIRAEGTTSQEVASQAQSRTADSGEWTEGQVGKKNRASAPQMDTKLHNNGLKLRGFTLENASGQVRWLLPIIPGGRQRRAEHLRSAVQDQPDQHGETSSLLKIQN
ncbi:hypothetical protein AAY473_011523 [Plecturocebus cupreus]